MLITDLFPFALWSQRLEEGYIRVQTHPSGHLLISNYTQKAAYEGAWDEVTTQCRGLIHDDHGRIVARPFPKFFNYGEPSAPELDLDEPVIVTDKLDGSLGILYPTRYAVDTEGYGGRQEYAIASRGSFTSDQALHATDLWETRYAEVWQPHPGHTYLFEIVYPSNRIVCDYGDLDDLILLAVLDIETGLPASPGLWPGPRTGEHPSRTLSEALQAPARAGAEGYVIYLVNHNQRVKVKQDDYVALHRILTGTNARHVWEVAAVQNCRAYIREPKHWGTYLGIDPERAAQIIELGDDWLADVPDEFYGWVRGVIDQSVKDAQTSLLAAVKLATVAAKIEDRKTRYDYIAATDTVYLTETMRLASDLNNLGQFAGLYLRCWRESVPEPTAPFARDESIA